MGDASRKSQLRWALEGSALDPAPVEEAQTAADPPENWSTTPLQLIDPDGAGLFTVRAATLSDCWLLQQGRAPVGLIKQADGDNKLRTASEEWRTTRLANRIRATR